MGCDVMSKEKKEKMKRCVEHVKEQGKGYNPHAVCQASVGKSEYMGQDNTKGQAIQRVGGSWAPKFSPSSNPPKKKPVGHYKSDLDDVYDLVKGYDKGELKEGKKVEVEHSDTIKRIQSDSKAGKLQPMEKYFEGIAKDHLDEIKDYYTRLTKMEDEAKKSIVKGGGEGSRGGKVIGHTKSGKAIYESSLAGGYKGWTKEDHGDAHKKHQVEAENAHSRIKKETQDAMSSGRKIEPWANELGEKMQGHYNIAGSHKEKAYGVWSQKSEGGNQMDILKSIGIIVSENAPNLIVHVEGNSKDLVKSDMAIDCSRMGLAGNTRDMIENGLRKGQYGDENLKNTHGEQFHTDNCPKVEKMVTEAGEIKPHGEGQFPEKGTPIGEAEDEKGGPKIPAKRVTLVSKKSLQIPERELMEKTLLKAEGDDEDSEAMPKTDTEATRAAEKEAKEESDPEGTKEEKEESEAEVEDEGAMDEEAEKSLSVQKGLFTKESPKAISEWEPDKKAILSQIIWKLREMKELQDTSWMIESKVPEAKEFAEKKWNSLEGEIKELIKKYSHMGKSESVEKGEKKKEDDIVKIVKKKAPKNLATLHENSEEMRRSDLDEVYDLVKCSASKGKLVKEAKKEPSMKTSVRPPMRVGKSMSMLAGPGGVVFDFGDKTGNPCADNATALLRSCCDRTQQQIAEYQEKEYRKALTECIVKGEDRYAKEHNVHMDAPPAPVQNVPIQKPSFMKSEMRVGGSNVQAMSETDAALIEMMKSQGFDSQNDGTIIDVTTSGVTVDLTTPSAPTQDVTAAPTPTQK
jgi:hypothetical protein